MTWEEQAACRDADPEIFFPPRGGKDARVSARGAKLICARCPVSEECLDFAVEKDIKYGVWGGLSEKERRALRRAKREREEITQGLG